MRKEKLKTCPICNKTYEGYGNSPEPLNYRGQVCDECNVYVVVPTRLLLLQYMNKVEKK